MKGKKKARKKARAKTRKIRLDMFMKEKDLEQLDRAMDLADAGSLGKRTRAQRRSDAAKYFLLRALVYDEVAGATFLADTKDPQLFNYKIEGCCAAKNLQRLADILCDLVDGTLMARSSTRYSVTAATRGKYVDQARNSLTACREQLK